MSEDLYVILVAVLIIMLSYFWFVVRGGWNAEREIANEFENQELDERPEGAPLTLKEQKKLEKKQVS